MAKDQTAPQTKPPAATPLPTPTPGPYPDSKCVPDQLDQLARILFRCDDSSSVKCFGGFDDQFHLNQIRAKTQWTSDLHSFGDSDVLLAALDQLAAIPCESDAASYRWATALAKVALFPNNESFRSELMDSITIEGDDQGHYRFWARNGASIAYLAFQFTSIQFYLNAPYSDSYFSVDCSEDDIWVISRAGLTDFPIQTIQAMTQLPFQQRVWMYESIDEFDASVRTQVWEALQSVANIPGHPLNFEAQLALSASGWRALSKNEGQE